MIGSESCEVFYRDIVECIRSLFGDPNFTPYLHFAPEKHYTDDTKDTRMYHDMYTGKWWWATQVSVQKPMPGIEYKRTLRRHLKGSVQAR